MRKELDEKLCADFPELFAERNLPMQETTMCWGFDTDDGWHDLIHGLSKDITGLCRKYGAEIPHVVQVKEKLGGLRYYTGGVDPKVADGVFHLIMAAEMESYHVCEVCGKPGRLRIRDGWYKTICADCAKNRLIGGLMKRKGGWKVVEREEKPKKFSVKSGNIHLGVTVVG